jgi:hypothetical protein
MNRELISGGFILLSRKLLRSGIMTKPPLFIKAWVWMLLQASFKDHGDLKRGQFFTSYQNMSKSLAYKVGYRTVRPTKRELERVTKYLTKVGAIVPMKVLHGMVITILNYSYYQNPKNYEGANERANAGANEVLIARKKGIMKGKTPAFFSFKKKYNQKLIDQVFDAFASCRKSNQIAESVLIAQLQKWEKYPVAQVEAGIKTYLEKDYAAQGKGENYLLGIIRNQKSKQPVQPDPTSPPAKEITLENIGSLYEN